MFSPGGMGETVTASRAVVLLCPSLFFLGKVSPPCCPDLASLSLIFPFCFLSLLVSLYRVRRLVAKQVPPVFAGLIHLSLVSCFLLISPHVCAIFDAAGPQHELAHLLPCARLFVIDGPFHPSLPFPSFLAGFLFSSSLLYLFTFLSGYNPGGPQACFRVRCRRLLSQECLKVSFTFYTLFPPGLHPLFSVPLLFHVLALYAGPSRSAPAAVSCKFNRLRDVTFLFCFPLSFLQFTFTRFWPGNGQLPAPYSDARLVVLEPSPCPRRTGHPSFAHSFSLWSPAPPFFPVPQYSRPIKTFSGLPPLLSRPLPQPLFSFFPLLHETEKSPFLIFSIYRARVGIDPWHRDVSFVKRILVPPPQPCINPLPSLPRHSLFLADDLDNT